MRAIVGMSEEHFAAFEAYGLPCGLKDAQTGEAVYDTEVVTGWLIEAMRAAVDFVQLRNSLARVTVSKLSVLGWVVKPAFAELALRYADTRDAGQ